MSADVLERQVYHDAAAAGWLRDDREATLPTDSQERKDIPLVRGLLDYFPAALAAVAEVSKAGNDKHNPGQEMHHARGKSMDHPDCIVRHLVDRGTTDPEDGLRHSAKVAWRALALLQEELEAAGAPLARGARLADPDEYHDPFGDEADCGREQCCGGYNCPYSGPPAAQVPPATCALEYSLKPLPKSQLPEGAVARWEGSE